MYSKTSGSNMPSIALLTFLMASVTAVCPVHADGPSGKAIAPLKPDMPYLFVVHQGRSIKIERDLDRSFKAPPETISTLLITNGKCPPFCLQPAKLDAPVETAGEVEIIDFMSTELRNNEGALIDVRSARNHKFSTIPGSHNYFITLFQKGAGDEEFDAMLEALGAKRRGEVSWHTRLLEDWGLVDTSQLTGEWDFTGAKKLIVWGWGPTSDLSARAINALLEAGYPAAKVRWYRGGLPAWQYWGFTTFKTKKR